MTLDEASQVLAHAGHSSAGLVALADGWPAVIGLAALLPGEVNPTSDAQPALFDYVAQELFDELAPDVQKASRAAVGAVDADAGARDRRCWATTRNACCGIPTRVGFVTAREPNEIEIHPLCRAFLEQKLWDVGVSKRADRQARAEPDRRRASGTMRSRRSERSSSRTVCRCSSSADSDGCSRRDGRAPSSNGSTLGRSSGISDAEVALAKPRRLLAPRRLGAERDHLQSRSARSVGPQQNFVAQAHLCAGVFRSPTRRSRARLGSLR